MTVLVVVALLWFRGRFEGGLLLCRMLWITPLWGRRYRLCWLFRISAQTRHTDIYCFTILTSDRTSCSTPDPSTASSRFSAGNTNYYKWKNDVIMKIISYIGDNIGCWVFLEEGLDGGEKKLFLVSCKRVNHIKRWCILIITNKQTKMIKRVEDPGIDPGASRMLSGRSTIWARPPMLHTHHSNQVLNS